MEDHASSSQGADPVWKKLWHLNISLKAKIFLWRAMWDIILHNENLVKKGALESSKCPRCGDNESSFHVFRDYGWARIFWRLKLPLLYKTNVVDIRSWFTATLDSNQGYLAELMVVLLWHLWFSWNEFCFEKIYSSPKVSYKRAKDSLDEYKRWNDLVPKTTPHRMKTKWSKPSSGIIKLNFDAALNSHQDQIGLGAVARDEKGHVLMVDARSHPYTPSAEMAELLAAELGSALGV